MENMENTNPQVPEQPAEQLPVTPTPELRNEPLRPAAEIPQAPEAPAAPETPAAPAAEDSTYRYVPVRPAAGYADSPHETTQPAPGRKKKKAKASGKRVRGILCAILALAVLAGACVTTGALVNSRWERRASQMEADFKSRLEALEKKVGSIHTGVSVSGSPLASVEGMTPAQVYAMNVNSVVMIYNKVSVMGQTGTSTGSGFILTEDGYVVTNHHVVEGDGLLSVVTADGTSYPAKLVGSDNTNDVALLKLEVTGLQPVTLGSSDDLIVGDQVVAIGNPLGELTSTLTVGYVSAKERDVTTDGFAINMLQTDAAINSGNSGGPLFNMKGEVVGITTAKYSGTSSSGASIEGVGFAIPIDDVSGLLSDLATYGYVTGAYLGVSVSDMDPAAANYYGLPMGAYVNEATEGYAAAKAGVKAKDIITAIGNMQVETVNDLTRALRSFHAGDETVITVFRSGKELKLTIVLDAKPGQEIQ